MKVSSEESKNIKDRFKFLIEEAELSKRDAIGQLMVEFERPRSTVYDHCDIANVNFPNIKEEKEEVRFKEKPQEVNQEINKTKILLFDIETFANLAYVWGKYDQNVIDFEQEWFILSACYKWLGEDQIYSVSLPDFKETYNQDATNDYYVVKKIWELLDECDICIAHNGDKFDIKKVYARFLYHGFPPPSPFKSVDTVKVARRVFNMNSNKLDDIGRYLGIGRKVVHTGWDLWKRCRRGDQEAWAEMIEYNEQDVVLLERVYEKFKPFIANHPNINLYQETDMACPNCGSDNLQKRGFAFSRTTKTQRFQCMECGAWSSGNKLVR